MPTRIGDLRFGDRAHSNPSLHAFFPRFSAPFRADLAAPISCTDLAALILPH
jgi:hypothetical protein